MKKFKLWFLKTFFQSEFDEFVKIINQKNQRIQNLEKILIEIKSTMKGQY